jgi:hypothetical protein
MSEVKIVLKRSPMDPDNGVWIDGVKLEGVKEVSVFGGAGQVPQVTLTLLPKTLTLGLDNPDLEQIPENEKN